MNYLEGMGELPSLFLIGKHNLFFLVSLSSSTPILIHKGKALVENTWFSLDNSQKRH
jgi:hypothetical protein